MRDDATVTLELAEIAASYRSPGDRAEALLATLRRVIPFDAAWIGLADPPPNGGFTPLASTEIAAPVLERFRGPGMSHPLEASGVNRRGPPGGVPDRPGSVTEPATWGEHLLRAGFSEGFGVGLFAPGGRHIGHLGILFAGRQPPSDAARQLLARLTPALAHAVDPVRSLLAAARLVQGATAGVAVRDDGATDPLPGLHRHVLLAESSATVRTARASIRQGHLHTSFLWPMGGSHAPGGHVRITALAVSEGVPAAVIGVVLVSTPGDLRGLTARELEILGHLIAGRSNRQIAQSLIVAPRTVAAHLEHILVKLTAPTRTLAAVRAERAGLYVPHPASATD